MGRERHRHRGLHDEDAGAASARVEEQAVSVALALEAAGGDEEREVLERVVASEPRRVALVGLGGA